MNVPYPVIAVLLVFFVLNAAQHIYVAYLHDRDASAAPGVPCIFGAILSIIGAIVCLLTLADR
jgi:hypothetical protein